MVPTEQVLCVVMDGVGIRASQFGNAVALANAPALRRLCSLPLYTTLQAHGTAVGLPTDDDIGNSEVGHNAIGAGRIFDQGAKLVNAAIATGSLFNGQAWKEVTVPLIESNKTLHFIGLLSDGNVHSHEKHLYAMLRAAKSAGVKHARIHALLDGRDVSAKSAEIYIGHLEAVMEELRSSSFDVQVASGGGRMAITMDRYDADWQMVHRGWQAHVLGKAEFTFTSLSAALAHFRKDDKLTDQNIPAFVLTAQGQPVGRIQDGDSVIFFNFRGDRAIEITRAFTEADFHHFDREHFPSVAYAGMMQYDGDLHLPPRFLVSPPLIDHPLSEYLLQHHIRQFACSETQKFGHVTYFWNGNRSGYLDSTMEEYVEVPSDPAAEFEAKPQMKAKEITDVAIDRMRRRTFGFGRINLANGDMVGHTGSLEATIKAVEAVDQQLARLMLAADETGTTLLVTADHGNADEMFDAKERDFPNWHPGATDHLPKAKTAHTLAEVPLAIYGKHAGSFELAGTTPRGLGNIANTVIELLGLPLNKLYLPSLIRKKGS